MKRIVCYCLAISMIPVHRSLETDCTEPQLFVKETYCFYNNIMSLSMYTYNEELKVNLSETTFSDNGCSIDFNEQSYLNNTFLIECDTERINCVEDSEDTLIREAYYLECEELDYVGDNDAIVKELKDENERNDKSDVLTILGCSVGALGATVATAFGMYSLKSYLQSGKYFLPDTASPAVPDLA